MDDVNELRSILSASLSAARERAGLTQAEVAIRVGIAAPVYGRIERGHMLPSVPTLRQLCVALNLRANELIGLNPEDMKVAVSREEVRDSPELRRFANILRTLSPASLRALSALASVIAK